MSISVGQRAIFVFGYCMGIPNYDDGVITTIDGDWITVECNAPDDRSRIPLKSRGTVNYRITLHVSRLLKKEDEARVIDAWYHFFINRSDETTEKLTKSSETLIDIARQYHPLCNPLLPDERTRDYTVML